jgi:putative ABC transport system permease protein
MNLVDTFRLAVHSLAAHKLRTALTMLGMMFGVAAVIAMLSIGAGAEQRALAMIERLGIRNIVIDAKEAPADQTAIRDRSLGLSPRDVGAIEDAVPGVELVLPRIEIAVTRVIAAGAKTHAKAFGVSARHREAVTMTLAEGRHLSPADETFSKQRCVIGAGVRRALFGAGPAVGKDVEVNDLWCEVVGVLAPQRALAMEGVAPRSTDGEVYMPVTTASARLDRSTSAPPLGEIVVRVKAGVSASEVGAQIGALLQRVHGGVRDYEITVPEQLLAHSRETRRLFDLVMGLIAGISLIVGGVGIVNVMLASVLEQTREIGVRRAIGARRADIQRQFLITAFSLALFGGGIGVALGVGLSRGVAASAGWPTVVTLPSIALSLCVSVGVGVLTGFYPARRAAQLDPIAALGAA